jgi:hypothetical protein
MYAIRQGRNVSGDDTVEIFEENQIMLEFRHLV